jgi:hypothetical protein
MHLTRPHTRTRKEMCVMRVQPLPFDAPIIRPRSGNGVGTTCSKLGLASFATGAARHARGQYVRPCMPSSPGHAMTSARCTAPCATVRSTESCSPCRRTSRRSAPTLSAAGSALPNSHSTSPNLDGSVRVDGAARTRSVVLRRLRATTIVVTPTTDNLERTHRPGVKVSARTTSFQRGWNTESGALH